ncbi:electron transport complex subunit RsxE [Clostridium formicaceticum]|uniref:Ion-translocating oxidoreductase complex subunit E n=1 Tax=Clostridium formicaceticum TaxID=1497 RepID=A0AAC9RKH1_9CLOT|nr:electron transport complex subunit E [Clostridium formicaceticum]AOY76845.1 electron transport complex subunit RsxE [Clostridium formicaceticum]ARE87322.1 Electron transport complex protein RnfE [Clostridium formicaceticum]
MKLNRILIKGLIYDNPTFVQMLGMCPTLAVTNSAFNALGMGLATTAVLIGSNVVISMLRNFIPSKIRIPAFVVVIATFVTMVGMMMRAYLPALNAALGLFIPLIVVNCLILARAESFASKSSMVGSAVDGVGMGLGFTGALVILGIVRELTGAGTIFGRAIMGSSFEPARFMTMPPGAFLALGLLLALINKIGSKDLNEL